MEQAKEYWVLTVLNMNIHKRLYSFNSTIAAVAVIKAI